MFDLLKNCEVNRSIIRGDFYKKNAISSASKNEFVNLVDDIIWKYKISEDTLEINKTDEVEEIEVFEIKLKEKKHPKNVIKTLSKIIPYPILFIINYKNYFCYAIRVNNIYFTDWNEEINILFSGINLENVYENIVKSIIKKTESKKDFSTLISDKNKEIELSKKIEQLKNKIKIEKQFNKKFELNKQIKEMEQELEVVLNG